jgi:hypothetical protein
MILKTNLSRKGIHHVPKVVYFVYFVMLTKAMQEGVDNPPLIRVFAVRTYIANVDNFTL